MKSRGLAWTLIAATGIATAAAGPGPRGPAEAEPTVALACVPGNNVEAIIDDSRSMADNDPGLLRLGGMELFISTVSPGRVLGAVEFGSQADTVFAPGPIDRGPMVVALRARIAADAASGPTATGIDHGRGTDYNDGFDRGTADNPTASARIFLTDGAHNENEYVNAHRNGPPTYVIGLGIGPQEGQGPGHAERQGKAEEAQGPHHSGGDLPGAHGPTRQGPSQAPLHSRPGSAVHRRDARRAGEQPAPVAVPEVEPLRTARATARPERGAMPCRPRSRRPAGP